MATPNQKLADSLKLLKKLQEDGRRVFRHSELTRVHRERLTQNGFLNEVIKGWYISTSPHAVEGDTTPWYASFWQFCSVYCRERFDDKWHLSPEQSLLLHAEATTIPPQVIIYSPKGTNNNLPLPFGTSLYDLKQKQMPPPEDLIEKEGLRLFTPEAALLKVTEAFFQGTPVEAQIVLASIRDVSSVLRTLLDGGHSQIAGRLAGAFRRAGREEFAEQIIKTMTAAGYDVRENDPFTAHQSVLQVSPGIPPITGRLQAIWESQRQIVIDNFPPAPGLPEDRSAYMKSVEDIFENDAYHSLSIEGYSVTPELIDRVQQGNWDPNSNDADKESRDALAARGYWQAFQLVKDNVASIIDRAEPGKLIGNSYPDWYREMFQPSVQAGLMRPGALAGFRNHPVYIRGSRHVPPRHESVPDGMQALFTLLQNENQPSVRAVLGHWIFGYIHPYPDGNGRMARFLMNTMLASGGYPWTIVRVEDRPRYMTTLETASGDINVQPFALFLSECVKRLPGQIK